MIDLKLLRQLVKLMAENDLSEVDLQDGEEKVKLKRGAGGQPVQLMQPAPTAPVAAASATPAPSGATPPDPTPLPNDTLAVTAPLARTWPTSSTPAATSSTARSSWRHNANVAPTTT